MGTMIFAYKRKQISISHGYVSSKYCVFFCIIGVAHTQAVISWGRRWSVAHSYLVPAMNRDNLHVATGAFVTKVTTAASV